MVDQVFCIASVVLNSSMNILYQISIKVLKLLTTFVYSKVPEQRGYRGYWRMEEKFDFLLYDRVIFL